MFYTIYQIKNKLNSKIYVGMHQTDNLDDGYMGSGKLIQAAITKYGAENFEKIYVAVYDDRESMIDAERLIVNEAFVARSDTYNLKQGGEGGWDHIPGGSGFSGRVHTEATKQRKAEIARQYWQSLSREEQIEWMAKAKAGLKGYDHGSAFRGKHHTEETKAHLRALASKRTGAANSGYGSKWLSHYGDRVSKKVTATQINDYLAKGWVAGRVIDWNKVDIAGAPTD